MRRFCRLAGMVWLLTTASCSEEKLAPLRVGINPWPGYGFLFLAEELGYFAEEGTSVRLVELSSNGDVRREYERGRVEVGTCTIIDLVTIRALSDKKPRLLHVCDFSDGADQIIARGGITHPRDLRGKRVAAEPTSLDMVHLSLALKEEGLTLEDVEVVNMAQGRMPAALASGTIDAAVTYPPSSFEAMDTPGAASIFDTSRIPGAIVDVLIAEEKTLRDRTSDIEGLVRAFDRAVHFWLVNPEEAVAIMAHRQGMTEEELGEAFGGIRILTIEDQQGMLAIDAPIWTSIGASASMLEATGVKNDVPNPSSLLWPRSEARP